MSKLTALSIKAASKAGRYGDGDGLFLLVGRSGSKSWLVRVQKDGKRRDLGLGSAAKVPLKLARERARLVRAQIEAGIDPVAQRRKEAGIPTFREASKIVHGEHKSGWKNSKHATQWFATLETYAFPAFGEVAVSRIEAPAIRDALAAIWLSKPETARRVRQRVRTVIDWAVAKGYRDSPLAMAVIDKALPKQRQRVKHHAALPYAEMPEFMAALRAKETMGRLALEAVILAAARSGEVRLAEWDEVDLIAATWRIPALRMKAGREHVVPLSAALVDLFGRMKSHRRANCSLIFPGAAKGRPLSDMTLTKALRDMKVDAVPHGFRSTFRDWIAEATKFPSDLAEAALAHVISDRTVAAYQRGSMLEKRRALMGAWADYCNGAGAARVAQLVSAR